MLGLLAATLAGLAAFQLAAGLEEEAPGGVAMPVRPPAAAPSPAPRPATASLDEILERPVFAPSRRRVLPIAEAQAAPPPPPPPAEDPPLSQGFVLLGIVQSGEEVAALLRETHSRALHRLRRGEALQGWTLAGAAGRRALLFEREGERQILEMPAGTPAGPAASSDPGQSESDE